MEKWFLSYEDIMNMPASLRKRFVEKKIELELKKRKVSKR